MRHVWFAFASAVLGLMGAFSCAPVFAVDKGMEQRVETVDFRGVPLQDALNLFARQTGLNLTASRDARSVPVTLFLRDVTAKAAIEELCGSNELSFREDEESHIVRIMTLAEFQKNLVSVREEKTQVFTLLYPNVVEIALAIHDLYGDRVSLSLDRDTGQDASRDLASRFREFDIVDQRRKDLGFSRGTSSSGSSVTTSSGGGSVTTFRTGQTFREDNTRQALSREDDFRKLTPDQAQQLQELLAKAETPEAREKIEELRNRRAAIRLSINRRNNLIVVRTSDDSALKEIDALIHRLDVPTPMVMMEVKLLSIDLGDDFNSVFDFQFSDGVNNSGGFTTGNIQPPDSDSIAGTARKAASLALGGTGVRADSMIFQFVNNSFRARLQVLEGKNRVTTLATPTLLTTNNEVSRLFIGEERPIVDNISSQTFVNDNVVTTAPNTSFTLRPVGTMLLITPSINSDGTVTLKLVQENSTINEQSAQVPVVNNGTVQNVPVDTVQTRSVSGTIVGKNDLMVAIGGLIEEGVMDKRSAVPVLGKIPGLGVLFRRQRTERTRRELVILLKPHVITTPAQGEGISQNLMKEISIHPQSPTGEGMLETFKPREVLKPKPPKDTKESTFRTHNLTPSE